MHHSNSNLFAFTTDEAGKIIRKIVCPPLFCDHQPPHDHIKDFFNKDYHSTLDSFLEEIYHNNKPVVKSFQIELQDQEMEINIIGANINDGFLIIGNESMECIDYRVFEELMMINNEQANHIRNLIKANHLQKNEQFGPGELYRQLTEINNELVNAQRQLTKKNAELEKAIKQIDMLSRMIPICSNCKKIRDDDGFWEQLESYMSRHSKMVFSHGICPDCMVKLYPDYVKKKQKTNQPNPDDSKL